MAAHLARLAKTIWTMRSHGHCSAVFLAGGGFIGVCLAIFLVARMRKIPLWSFADIWAMLTPIVIFSVRVFGNFFNAELYGRHTDSSLGMIFPEGYTPNNYGLSCTVSGDRLWKISASQMRALALSSEKSQLA